MDNIKVSVIVPAYNTGDYVENMINCLLAQTYKNLQIIIVDDGSTDNTGSIIKKYVGVRGLEYYYQENSGVSSARNFGMTKATGEKIFFFDSDDSMEPDTIELCVNFSKDNNVESVLFGYANKVNKIITNIHDFVLDGIYRNEQIPRILSPAFLGYSYNDINLWLRGKAKLRERKEHTALWRIMLDSSVVKKNNLQFDENLSIGEDTKFINMYLLFTKSVGILRKTLYYLNIRPGSANVTNNKSPILMATNKIKVIQAKKAIDKLALTRNIITYDYWQGNIVLSAIQLALYLSHCNHGYNCYKNFINNLDVKFAVRDFKPYCFSIKSVPFVLLKFNWRLLFLICALIPNKIIKRLTI